MSWQAYGTIKGGKLELTVGDLTEEMEKQLDVAAGVAHDLAASGALGDKDGEYRVTLTGHANPEHKPVAGWSNDFINVVITQVGEVK